MSLGKDTQLRRDECSSSSFRSNYKGKACCPTSAAHNGALICWTDLFWFVVATEEEEGAGGLETWIRMDEKQSELGAQSK